MATAPKRQVGFGRCAHCGLVGIKAKKNGTAYQHLHSRVRGKNIAACQGSGKPLEDLMWFPRPDRKKREKK